ncbi:caspase family protein [Alienimonas sp. DA493]|uniref:caspase family protein n=1 Tax=Alienimonas sp. DA493 TaxID=3373605 RepID=UPI003755083A
MSKRLAFLLAAASWGALGPTAAECLGQSPDRPDWRTAMAFPRVKTDHLGTTRTNEAVVKLRETACPCGCGMKLAQCLVDDPNCTHSPPAAQAIVDAIWRTPRLHVLAITDEFDKSIGVDCEADRLNVLSLVESNVDNALIEVEEFSERSAAWRERMTAEHVLARIGSLKVAPHDAVFFYYSGHGLYTDRAGHLFHMPHGNTELRRASVLAALKKHNARLTVLISDTCYTRWTGKEPAAAARVWNDRTRPLMRSLFFESTGVVDVTSSERDEFSMVYPKRSGSLFTGSLERVVEANLDRPLTWSQVFQAIRADTQRQFARYNPQGVPNGDGVQTTQTPLALSLAQRTPR